MGSKGRSLVSSKLLSTLPEEIIGLDKLIGIHIYLGQLYIAFLAGLFAVCSFKISNGSLLIAEGQRYLGKDVKNLIVVGVDPVCIFGDLEAGFIFP